MFDWLPSISDAVQRICSSELHPRELVEACLARIESFEPRVRAWVMVDADRARRDADRLGRAAAEGTIAGPLHGVPIGVKDIVDAAGWPTKAGSPLRKNHVAERDAPVVARLRRAGAIVLGKTVTTEFACFDPPPTANPWNLERTPGGSSSGSAAATAMEMCLGAVGSQTGGSITRPASFCGVAGLKPTHGRVPVDGVVPISPRLDHVGPIARRVSDLAAMYSVMSDEPGAWIEFHQAVDAARPPRLIVLRELFFETADANVAAVVEEALGRFPSSSAPRIETAGLPDVFSRLAEAHKTLMAVDAAEYHREQFAKHESQFGHHVAELIRAGLSKSRSEYEDAVRVQAECRRAFSELLSGDRIAVTPATRTAAPGRETTGDPAFNAPWSFCGLPTVSVPCGLTADSSLPCSLQLIGAPWSEVALLAAAAWCESRLGRTSRPPLFNNAPNAPSA